MSRRRLAVPVARAAAALAVTGLVVAGCGGDDAPTVPSPPDEGTASTTDATDGGAAPTDEGTATGGSTGGEGTGEVTGTAPADEALLAAIGLAEQDAGGTAFEVDDGDDDGSWEVHVAVGAEEVEVEVSADGSAVLSRQREGDLDDDDAAALDLAGVGLAEAVGLAAAGREGTADVDDAGFADEGGGTYAWEVTFTDDVEVYLDVTDGSVLRVEDD
ncbi:PepSY domain-containing protein [Pseudokineococcus sp. 1T1Z-3]|uniref:PepSY domain-containing protein n=1 Tax=Pseudokineococcus sp. 1T1Z-3 TaxID=3132745 RepID=UPI0030B083D4